MSILARITTIVPTYRRPSVLARAIQSTLGQSFADFKIVVYDNASGDETGCVVAELGRSDPRVKYVCQPRNIGGLANFAFALQQIDTPFFNILSDDDQLCPGFFGTAMEAFQTWPEAALFVGLCLTVDSSGRVLEAPIKAWREGLYRPPEGFFAAMTRGHPTWTSVMFRRELLDTIGFRPEVGSPSDVDFELRALSRFSAVVSWRPCAIVVSHPGSYYLTAGLNDLPSSILKILENVRHEPAIEPELRYQMVAAASEWAADFLYRSARKAALDGHPEDAASVLEALEQKLGARRSCVLSLLCDKSIAGSFFRAACRTARFVYLALLRTLNLWSYRRYRKIIANALVDIVPLDFARTGEPESQGITAQRNS